MKHDDGLESAGWVVHKIFEGEFSPLTLIRSMTWDREIARKSSSLTSLSRQSAISDFIELIIILKLNCRLPIWLLKSLDSSSTFDKMFSISLLEDIARGDWLHTGERNWFVGLRHTTGELYDVTKTLEL